MAYLGTPIGDFLGIALDGTPSEASYSGRILDGGMSLVHFASGRLHRGFFVELGALVRDQDTRVEDDNATSFSVDTDTTVIAARAMIGWSYRLAPVFASISVGASGEYERGSETHRDDPVLGDPMPTTKHVSRDALAAEGWIRIGIDFGK